MPQVDTRPASLDALARSGSPVTFTLTFPAAYLTGRTWSCTVGGTSITPAIAGDVMTIALTGAQTTALGNGRHAFILTDTTGDDAVRIAGRLLLTDSATASPDLAVTILTDSNVSVDVTVVSGIGLPLPSGTATVGLVPAVTATSPLTLAWTDMGTQIELNAEATARAAADTTLQTNITAEATARAAADTADAAAWAAAIAALSGTYQPLGSLRAVDDVASNVYTFVLTDAGKLKRFNWPATIPVTIPPNSSVAFPVGTVIEISQLGAGRIDLTEGAGVTLNTPGQRGLQIQYSAGLLIKTGTDTWIFEPRSSSLVAPLSPYTQTPRDTHVMAAQAHTSGHGWVDVSAAGTVDLNDATDYLLGSQSIKLTTNGSGGVARVDKTGLTAIDLSASDLVIWVKVDSGLANLNYIKLYAGSDAGAWTNFYIHNVEADNTAAWNNHFLQQGKWQKVTLRWSELDSTTGTPNRAAITRFRLAVTDRLGSPVVVRFGGIGYQPRLSTLYPNGVVSFCFDDGYLTAFTEGRKKLDLYGWGATAFIVDEAIDAAGGMTLAQLKELRDSHSWEVAAHAHTWNAHDNRFTSLTATQLQAELSAHRQWLLERGFKRPDHIAYPGGVYDDTVLDEVRKQFAAARTTSQQHKETLPPADIYRTRTMMLDSSLSIAQAQAIVDQTKTDKAWLIITGHKLASPADSITWTVADFSTLVDYVQSQGLAVRTIGHVLRHGIPPSASEVLSGLTAVDGAGSGLDADLLDGVSSGGYLTTIQRPIVRTGESRYYTFPVGASSSSSSESNGVARYQAIEFGVDCTLDRIGVEVVTTPGSTGSVVRIGLYADSSGLPGSLIADYGTVDTTATGLKEITINQAVTAGTRYWVATVAQGAPSTNPTLRAAFPWGPYGTTTNPAGGPCALQQTAVTGALGTPATVAATASGAAPRVFVRIA